LRGSDDRVSNYARIPRDFANKVSSLFIQRITILLGIIGPILLASTIITLTFIEYDFLLTLRWHPLYAPTTDWPSGLSLGEQG